MDTRVRSRTAAARAGLPDEHPAAPPQARAARDLQRARAKIAALEEQLFVLQEQNQQLRKDLAQHVCPRLCSRPYRSAS